jgi:hypothetical protein
MSFSSKRLFSKKRFEGDAKMSGNGNGATTLAYLRGEKDLSRSGKSFHR